MKRRVDEHRCFGRVPVVKVMRRELVMPFECARIRVEGQDRVAVKIVALALGPVVVGTRVARWPVEQPRVRIVGAREPRGRASVFDRPSDPRLGTWLASRRDRPEPPHVHAARGSKCVDESPNAFVSA